MFAEDLDVFTDAEAGIAVDALVDGVSAQIIFDAPGADVFEGQVATTEPSALIQATVAVAVGDQLVLAGGDLPEYLQQHAGTYVVRSVMPEAPDGAFVRAFLRKN